MLIKFRVKNFLSFYEEQELSMIKSRVTKHPDHVCITKSTQPSLLRSAAIFGANASGKSNLIKAVKFCRDIITGNSINRETIQVPIYKLNADPDPVSSFIFDILTNGNCYEYGFEINKGKLQKEWLLKTTKTSSKPVYIRENGKIKFTIKAIKKYQPIYDNLEYELKDQQLVLTMVNQKNPEVIISELRDVYLWFKDKLQIIFPDSRYLHSHAQMRVDTEFKDFIINMIRIFDTGIEGFKSNSYPLMDKKVNLPDLIKRDIAESIEKNEVVLLSEQREYFLIHRDENDELTAEELVVIHRKNISKEEVEFHFREESEGTLRIFNLLPVLYQLTKKDSVVMIDEIGRSLHSLIPLKFLEHFYKTCKNHQNQLIITTHELMMLNLDHFRRDEIWFIAKNSQNASCLYSLEEFKTRFDKELLSAYLDGRYNAIPIL